jgi:hypothetical protein
VEYIKWNAKIAPSNISDKWDVHSEQGIMNILKKYEKIECSKFAQHILLKAHNYDNMEKTMKILYVERKGQMLNTSENYYIYI